MQRREEGRLKGIRRIAVLVFPSRLRVFPRVLLCSSFSAGMNPYSAKASAFFEHPEPRARSARGGECAM